MNIWQAHIKTLEEQISGMTHELQVAKTQHEMAEAKVKELEHCLKVSEDEVKRLKGMGAEYRQRNGAGRWM